MAKVTIVARLLSAIFLAALLISAIGSPSPAFAQLQPEAAARPVDKDLSTAVGSKPLQQLETEREALQNSLALTNEDIEKQLREFDKLVVDDADLDNQESQLEDLQAIIKRIGGQMSLWNLELEAGQRIKVVDAASRPQGDNSAARDVGIGIAGVAGFCAAFIVAGGAMLLVSRIPRRRWTWALGAGVATGALSASVAGILVPVRYEAQALIHVGKVVPVVLQNVSNGGYDDETNYDLYKKTQLQLLKSNFVLSRAARRSEMVMLRTMQEHKDDPVGFLERSLIVDYPGDAELLRVAIKGTHRDDLPIIVNSVVDAYMAEIVSGDKMARLKQRDLLVQHYSANQEAFRTKMEKYKKLAKDLGANSSDSARIRKKLAEQRLESLSASANRLRERIRDLDGQIALLKERKDNPPAAGAQ